MSWGNQFIGDPRVQAALRGAERPQDERGPSAAPPADRSSEAKPGSKKALAREREDSWPWSAMNKTETRFARRLEEDPQVQLWKFEGLTLKLGPGVSYRPDFVVLTEAGRIRFIEVKGGYVRDDSVAKFKQAAGAYGWLGSFEMWQQKSIRDTWEKIREI